MFITIQHLGWYSGCIGCYTEARITQWSCVQFSRNSACSRSHSGMHKIIVILSNHHGDVSSSVVQLVPLPSLLHKWKYEKSIQTPYQESQKRYIHKNMSHMYSILLHLCCLYCQLPWYGWITKYIWPGSPKLNGPNSHINFDHIFQLYCVITDDVIQQLKWDFHH